MISYVCNLISPHLASQTGSKYGYKSEWPQNRSYESFLEWFDVNLCEELIDLETESIKLEKL